MVGLADLKRYTDNIKKCHMAVNGKYCFFQLSGTTIYDFLDILNYKSWIYKTYQKSVTIRYVNVIKKLDKGNAVVRTSIGFGPLLLRFLRSKGFHIRDEDVEVFKARIVVFPDLKIRLYDFQERMVNDWLNAGGVGVVKSPTGSGKCCKHDTLILTPKGLIKIEDIVRKISDSGNKNKDANQLSLYDSFSEYENFEIDQENIKNVDSIISLSPRLKYGMYNISDRYDMGISDTITLKTTVGCKISGTPEHKIVIIDKDGRIKYKELKNISKDDYVAIAYNTNVFNDKLKLNYTFRPSKYDSDSYILTDIERMNEDIARLLGYIISEGNCAFSKSGEFIEISNYDKEINNDIIEICEKIGIRGMFKFDKDKNDGEPVGVDIHSKALVEFIYYLGYRHLAKNKEVPWSILQADKKSQIAFLKALFDGDGTVYMSEDKQMVEYNSSSYDICRQLQVMLLNIGIIARLDRKKGATLEYRGELRTYDESYRLLLYGENVLKYADIISFGLDRKKKKLDECVKEIKNRGKWSNIIYPYLSPYFKILYGRLKEVGKNGIYKDGKSFNSSNDFLKYNSFHKEIWSYINGERLPGRSTLEKILYLFSPIKDVENKNNSILREHGMAEKVDKYAQIYNYIQSLYDNFIFDKIENISEGKDRIYDITVTDIHSYIGNGMINHNTIVGCKAIKDIGRKTLILVHTSDLLINVWTDSLSKTFGPGIMSQTGIVGGGLTDSDRMTMQIGVRTGNFYENIRKDIVIATFQTLNNRLDELSQYKFGLMIVDETHHVPSQMFRKVNATIRAPYKMGLSATVRRLDGLERDIFGQLGDIQSSVSIRELINKGVLAEPRFQSPIIVDKDIIEDIETCGYGGLNLSRYVKKMSASSTKKKDYIINICKNIAARDRKFLLFTDYVNAEDVYIRDMYAEDILREGVRVSIIDQDMSSDERSTIFNYLESGNISGIVFGKLGSEGVNIPSVDAVIMANGLKSPITFCQRVGRAMRKIKGKDWCDVYEILLDTPMELRWSDFNFAEYKMEGFQKLTYKVE